MNFGIYSVRDEANGYVGPQIFPNDYAATRSFHSAVKNDSGINAFPADFSLYKLGDFDTDVGIYATTNPPVKIISALSVLGKEGDISEV